MKMKDNEQKVNDSSKMIMIGKDANGSKIIINNSEIEEIIQQQLHLYKQDIANLLEKNTPKWVYWVWTISIIALGLSLTSIFWGYNIKWNVEVISTAIILTFVGVLATFVVIGNYAQVKDIKDEFRKQMDISSKMEQELKKEIEIQVELTKRNITDYNDKAIKNAISWLYLDSSLLSQMNFGWEPNVVIGYLTCSIRPVLESENDVLLNRLINIVERHAEDIRIFNKDSPGDLIYKQFIDDFKLLLNKDKRVYDILQKIEKARTV
jgi:hypothetical protein